jgi:serine/threonine-protein kinase
MLIESHIRQLVEEALDSDLPPDEVCRDCPELLGEVRRQWQRVRAVDAEMEALFPRPDGPPPDDAALCDAETGLPRIEGYEVEAVVGRGGMGVVYRARQRRLNRPVALKMILAGAYASPQDRARFQREAEAVAALRHPNVVQVYDSGEVGGRPYFTMEFVEGGSLAQRLTGTPLGVRYAAGLVATLAEAVQVAHRAGIIHRDLKPANILLQWKAESPDPSPRSENTNTVRVVPEPISDFDPKVADFGLARYVEGGPELTLSGTRLGTPSYMAPEQALGRSRAIGPATDIYALGAILYELLTGRPPFKGESAEETERQVIAMDPVPPSRLNARVPRDLETICLKCLHKEPPRRYGSAAALADDLERFLRGEAIAARPEGRLWRLIRLVRRRPAFSTALAAGLLCAAALGGGGLWLASERAADSRAAEADRAANERAAKEDLQEMVRSLKKSSWPEARAALERGRGRLGSHGSAELRRLLDQGARDLDLGIRLEEIPAERWRNILRSTDNGADLYEKAFCGAGLGQVGDDPEVVAARVRTSNVTNALVAALDDWSALPIDPHTRRWALSVARSADPAPDPTGWRARARDPAIRGDQATLLELVKLAPVADQPPQLLLALARELKYDSPERLSFLQRIQRAHPGDFWANLALADMLWLGKQRAEAIRYYQAAVASRPRTAYGYDKLGLALGMLGRLKEAVEQFRRAVDIDPLDTVGSFWLAKCLFDSGRQDEAIEQLRVAIRFNPNHTNFHTFLAHYLEVMGRYEEALPVHRQVVALKPNDSVAQAQLRALLVRLGRGDEARIDWQKSLEAGPPEFAAWDGYAEFCLFLGQEDEYGRARHVLLAKFGTTTNPYFMQRTALACLLRPATGDELRQAVALAGRAAAVDRTKYGAVYAHFLFTRGLADYRQGRFEEAIAAMRGEAGPFLGPAPGLVLAMALYQNGQVEEARETLAAAIGSHDWSTERVRNQHDWIYHVLRREAERLVQSALPDLPEGPR